uniref:hypothetical protein n=1 Tax=uncultured Succinivibrio sp. TaxID=540749 RepID=UPI0025F5F6E6
MQILAQQPVITVQNYEDTCRISITVTNDELKTLSCPYCHSSLTRFGYYYKHPRAIEFNLRLLKLTNPEVNSSQGKLEIRVPRLCCTSKTCPFVERNKSGVTTLGIFNPSIFMPFRQYLPELIDLTNDYITSESIINLSESAAQEKQAARKTIKAMNRKLSVTEDESDNDFFRDFITPCRKSRIRALVSALKTRVNYFFDKLLLTNYLSPLQSSVPLKNHNSPYQLPADSILSSMLFLLSKYVPLLPTQIAISYAR